MMWIAFERIDPGIKGRSVREEDGSGVVLLEEKRSTPASLCRAARRGQRAGRAGVEEERWAEEDMVEELKGKMDLKRGQDRVSKKTILRT